MKYYSISNQKKRFFPPPPKKKNVRIVSEVHLTLYSEGNGIVSTKLKWPERGTNHYLVAPRLKQSGVISPLPHVSSLCSA